MNYTRKDVDLFKTWGNENRVVTKLMTVKKRSEFQPHMFMTGYYSAPSWNWAYQFGIVKIGSKYYELMTQFGGVVGGREIYIDKYTANLKRSN